MEIPHKGAFCDLVWSDPEDVETWAMSPRGAGWLFGSRVTNEVRWRLWMIWSAPGFLYSFPLIFSLFTSTTWSSYVVLTNSFTKDTNTCSKKSWSPYGLHQTIAIAVGISLQFWRSLTRIRKKRNCSKLSLIAREWSRHELQHHIFCRTVNIDEVVNERYRSRSWSSLGGIKSKWHYVT